VTYAPTDLLDIRRWLLVTLDLAADAIGIVGDPDHVATGGYHEGNDDLNRVGRLLSDYSKRESSRDRPGSNAASAIDIGYFEHRRPDGSVVTLRSLSVALVERCKAGDPRCADIREVIYSPDGKRVLRWDRLGIRESGDSSHLTHTHISLFRDSEGRRADARNLLGLLRTLIEGDDMGAFDELLRDPTGRQPGPGKAADLLWIAAWNISDTLAAVRTNNAGEVARDAAFRAAFDSFAKAVTGSAGGTIDTAPILARIDAVAAAESAAMGKALAELAAMRAELASSRQEAERLRERLAAALAPPASG